MSKIIDALNTAIKATFRFLHKWWMESDQKWREQQAIEDAQLQAENLYFQMTLIQERLYYYLSRANLYTIKKITDVTNIIIRDDLSNIYNNRFVFEIAKEDIFLTSSRKRELLFTMQHLINNIRYRNSYTLFDHNNIDISITHIEDHGISLLIYVSII